MPKCQSDCFACTEWTSHCNEARLLLLARWARDSERAWCMAMVWIVVQCFRHMEVCWDARLQTTAVSKIAAQANGSDEWIYYAVLVIPEWIRIWCISTSPLVEKSPEVLETVTAVILFHFRFCADTARQTLLLECLVYMVEWEQEREQNDLLGKMFFQLLCWNGTTRVACIDLLGISAWRMWLSISVISCYTRQYDYSVNHVH